MSQHWHFEPTSKIILTKNLEILGVHIFLNLSKVPINSFQKKTWNTWDGFKNFLPRRFFLLLNRWDIIILCSHRTMKASECAKHQTLSHFHIPVILIIYCSLSSCYTTGSLGLPNFLWHSWDPNMLKGFHEVSALLI